MFLLSHGQLLDDGPGGHSIERTVHRAMALALWIGMARLGRCFASRLALVATVALRIGGSVAGEFAFQPARVGAMAWNEVKD